MFAAFAVVTASAVIGAFISDPKRISKPVPTTVPQPKATTTTGTTGTTMPVSSPGNLVQLKIEELGTAPRYSRDFFGGGWSDEDGDCEDTRTEVLIRQSQSTVQMSECEVIAGLWRDPWSSEVATDPSKLDVDHTVPLANAWASGAWRWTPDQRIAYANDLSDVEHLVALPLEENRSKGDSGPDGWRPPLKEDWCRYALAWDRIKTKWQLSATAAEWNALKQMSASC